MKAPKVDRVTRRRLGPHTSHLSQSSLASDSIFTISHITNPDSTSVRVHTKQDRAEAREAWGAYELGEALRRRDRDRRRERERGYEQRQKRAAKAQGKRKASIEADDDDVSNEDESNEDEEAAKSIRSRSRSVSRGPPTRRTKRKRRRGTSTAGTSAAEDLDQDSEEEEVEEEEKEENQMFYQSEAVVPSGALSSLLRLDFRLMLIVDTDLPDSVCCLHLAYNPSPSKLTTPLPAHAVSPLRNPPPRLVPLRLPLPPLSRPTFLPLCSRNRTQSSSRRDRGWGKGGHAEGVEWERTDGNRRVLGSTVASMRRGSCSDDVGMLLEEHARTLAAQTQP